jgi:hypothetical protein
MYLTFSSFSSSLFENTHRTVHSREKDRLHFNAERSHVNITKFAKKLI